MRPQIYPVQILPPDIEAYRQGNTGVEFVTSFDSGSSGPHVMINALTHGNEICGAIALDRLFKLGVRPKSGKLTLCFVNHEAYSNFDAKNPSNSRFVDEDFNRVWLEKRLNSDEGSWELTRARELRPIFDDIDLLLDIHSMGTFSKPLIICNGLEKERRFARQVNFPGYIMCGSGHVRGKRLIEYTPFNDINNKKVAILVECGQHWARGTDIAAIDTALHFLRAAGILPSRFFDSNISSTAKNLDDAELWEVTAGIISTTHNFEFVEPYIGMEIIPDAGTIIAHDGPREIKTPYDDCLLMMPNHRLGKNVRKLRLCRRI